MPSTVFECPTDKCGYAIASDGMNKIQLRALRMWAKTCPQCGKIGHWAEKVPLLNTKTTQSLGGQKDAINSKSATKTASQKRRAARHDGLH